MTKPLGHLTGPSLPPLNHHAPLTLARSRTVAGVPTPAVTLSPPQHRVGTPPPQRPIHNRSVARPHRTASSTSPASPPPPRRRHRALPTLIPYKRGELRPLLPLSASPCRSSCTRMRRARRGPARCCTSTTSRRAHPLPWPRPAPLGRARLPSPPLLAPTHVDASLPPGPHAGRTAVGLCRGRRRRPLVASGAHGRPRPHPFRSLR